MRRDKPLKAPIFVNTRPIFDYHIKVFKICGLWPQTVQNNLKQWHRILSEHTGIGFALMLTLIGTLVFLKSLSEIIDNLLILSIVLLVIVKGIIIRLNISKIEELFEIFDELNKQITKPGEAVYTNVIIYECRVITKALTYLYLSSFALLTTYNLIADIHDGFWPSTTAIPFDFAQLKWVYWSVFIFQGFANFVMCWSGTAIDTYGVLLSNILGSHIEVLRYKLRTLGTRDNQDDDNNKSDHFHSELIACIEYHRKCLR